MHKSDDERTRSQSLVRRQRDIWRRTPVGRGYTFEIGAQVLTREWKEALHQHSSHEACSKDKECIIRLHSQPRTKLFSPHQAAGVPNLSSFTSTRVTHGQFIDSGDKFTMQDNWTCRTARWRDFRRPWTGRTVFVPKLGDTVVNPLVFLQSHICCPRKCCFFTFGIVTGTASDRVRPRCISSLNNQPTVKPKVHAHEGSGGPRDAVPSGSRQQVIGLPNQILIGEIDDGIGGARPTQF